MILFYFNHSLFSSLVTKKHVCKQDSRTSAIPNCTSLKETSYNGGIESLHTVSGYSGIVGTMKGGMDPHINALSEHLSSADIDIGWHKNESHGDRNGDSSHQSILNAEKKRTRNIGSKSKRLLMHSEDVLELRLTWEEAQDLLRPPPTSKPSVVTIEDLEFEEYDVSRSGSISFFVFLAYATLDF